MAYVVRSTTVNKDVALHSVSTSVETTYEAWDGLLDQLDAISASWTDEDALQSYAAAVASAVHANQALPGMVAMEAPSGILVVLGVIETGKP